MWGRGAKRQRQRQRWCGIAAWVVLVGGVARKATSTTMTGQALRRRFHSHGCTACVPRRRHATCPYATAARRYIKAMRLALFGRTLRLNSSAPLLHAPHPARLHPFTFTTPAPRFTRLLALRPHTLSSHFTRAPQFIPQVSLVHCHVLSHEDEGCMALLAWPCPGTPEAGAPGQQCPSSYPAC